jgi:hypothetical protein
MLVEQLDVATYTLCEESQEEDLLRLSVAAAKREIAAAELAATEAHDMILLFHYVRHHIFSCSIFLCPF